LPQKKRRHDEMEIAAMLKAGCTLGRCAGAHAVYPPEVPASATGDLRYEHENMYKAFYHGHLSRK
jgi:hypothetical protein